FFIKSDLMKIYGFSTEKYNELYPYIDLPEKVERGTIAKKSKKFEPRAPIEKSKPLVKFDINHIDTVELKKLKGIGSVLSARIIKYRNSLGGFISKNQLDEIYGLEEEILLMLKNHSDIFPGFEPQKINVNNADLKQLSAHPYISKKLAHRIIAYREQHGPYNENILLENLKELEEGTKEKVYPYLEF
ncbi:MAG: helix-hairpin-helix domain-containing protein, partial [Bacteroidota bacterium]|nr:helix-hairpin-helix domain-containing protein [Bacteroidota bacterium]